MKSLSNTIIAAIFALVITVLVVLSLHVHFFATKEFQTADQMMYLRYHLQHDRTKPDSHIVFASIDERTLQELDEAWPIHRDIHGAFLNVLAEAKPKVVGWDVFFTEEHNRPVAPANPPVPDVPPVPTPVPPSDASTNSVPANGAPATTPPAADPIGVLPQPPQTEDQVLVAGASLVPHMVTAAQRDDDVPLITEKGILPTRPLKNVTGDISKLLSAKSAIIPITALREKTTFGFADEDTFGGVRRTLPLMVNIGGMVLPSLDLQILMQYWDVDPDQVKVVLGHEVTLPRPDGTVAHIPINERGWTIINFRARIEDFQKNSYAYMAKGLADLANNQESKERDRLPPIKDNIVVVGVNLSGTDAVVTPLDSTAPGVVTWLNLLSNILQNDFVLPLTPLIWVPVYGLFMFGLANLMLRAHVPTMIGFSVVSIAMVAVVGFALLWFFNLQAPVAMPAMGILLLAIAVPSKGFFGSEREKIQLKKAMSTCLSEKIMKKMLEHPDNLKLGGEKHVITVMFCDIRGFTKYCDNKDPQEVMDVLNDYMEAMTQVVFKYDGTVDKYIGDCIMAFWNAPDRQPDHAQRAVCCAMEMRYALANFKTQRAGLDIELFECGIGIHTGEALIGMMGSTIKANYTAMGSTVNMGARLEALTKRLNERILISQTVVDQLTSDFPLTDRGEATVPGFATPVHVYAVGADQDISSALKVGRTLATKQDYTAEEVTAPIWKPAPLPEDADPNP